MANTLKVLRRDDDTIEVENYIVLFGGRDLHRERFVPDVDLKSTYTELGRFPVDWEHELRPDEHEGAVGYVDWSTAQKDDRGWKVRRILDRRNEYLRMLDDAGLINAGMLGTSSEAHPRKAQVKSDGSIVKWPLIADALTVTPVEPRMLTQNQLQVVKSLADRWPAFKSIVIESETGQGQSAEAAEDAARNETETADDTKTTSMGEGNMSDETKAAQAAPALTIDAIKSAFGEQVTPLIERVERLEKAFNEPVKSVPVGKAPAHLKLGLGNDPIKAYTHWIRTGDEGAIKASNDTDMNVGTAADGGDLVPTGHFQDIIARRDEMSLPSLVGVREIPGRGTSVDVPVDNEADGEFVSTNEAAAFDRDAPAVSKVTFTLVKYTKKVQLSYELLQDEDSRLMAFLSDFVGRGLAKTDNNLLLTEVGANGTSLKTFGSATAIAVDELEDIIYNNAMGPYLDTSGSVNWVMQPAVYGEIAVLDDQNIRRYADNAMGMSNTPGVPNLLGFPVRWSLKSGATAASTRSVYFGNWNFVGRYQAPSLTVLRDPYSSANTGQVNLFYYYRVDYGVLQAEAIGYGEHPSA